MATRTLELAANWGVGALSWEREASIQRSGDLEEVRQRMLQQRRALLNLNLVHNPEWALRDEVWLGQGIKEMFNQYAESVYAWCCRTTKLRDRLRRLAFPISRQTTFVAVEHLDGADQQDSESVLAYFRALAAVQQSKQGLRMVTPTLEFVRRVLRDTGSDGVFADFGAGPASMAKRLVAELQAEGHDAVRVACIDHDPRIVRLADEIAREEIEAGRIIMIQGDIIQPEGFQQALAECGTVLAIVSSLCLHENLVHNYGRILLAADALSQYGGHFKDVRDGAFNYLLLPLIALNLMSGGTPLLIHGMVKAYRLAVPDDLVGPLVEVVGGKVRNTAFFREVLSPKAAAFLGC